eukprot:TRINITY_DN9431_c0_g1_i2.p1 TRINITY_DN9431_c0_g1~~TRINITY_DN9431_c0_g1_i2.p1  ORF type:complete len:187 (-),score=41.77 TRINITY_DN9431_c0_g1_i2:236-796(-)
MAERVVEIADALTNHLKLLNTNGDREIPPTTAEILDNIHYFRVHDYVEQLALVNILPQFLRENPKIVMIIVDSVSFHFRQDFPDMALRARLLQGMGSKFMEIANNFEIDVVFMNQVTTKFLGQQETLVPALGQAWSHVSTNRVMLYWEDGRRYAHLMKSPSRESKSVPFDITPDGIRDVKMDEQLE